MRRYMTEDSVNFKTDKQKWSNLKKGEKKDWKNQWAELLCQGTIYSNHLKLEIKIKSWKQSKKTNALHIGEQKKWLKISHQKQMPEDSRTIFTILNEKTKNPVNTEYCIGKNILQN